LEVFVPFRHDRLVSADMQPVSKQLGQQKVVDALRLGDEGVRRDGSWAEYLDKALQFGQRRVSRDRAVLLDQTLAGVARPKD
jgi:hypothetical protein